MNKKMLGSDDDSIKRDATEYIVFIKESQITGRREYLSHVEVKKNDKYVYKQIKKQYSEQLEQLDSSQYDLISFCVTNKKDLEIEGVDVSNITFL